MIPMKTLPLLATLVLLVVLYAHIDCSALVTHLRAMHVGYFVLALGFFVPQTLVTALRWRWMVQDVCPMRTLEATRLILAGKALNALLPSKVGETSKAYFLQRHANVPLPHGVALVLLEKILDMAGLCALLLFGVLLAPGKGIIESSALVMALLVIAVAASIVWGGLGRWGQRLPGQRGLLRRILVLLVSWDAIVTRWQAHRVRLAGIVLLSCGLWCLHLIQIYLFFMTLHSTVPARLVFAYVPIGIAVGVLPITIGGMGTRDSALIYLFAAYEPASVMAGVGLLCSMRYWVDTLLGLPFFHAYAFEKAV